MFAKIAAFELRYQLRQPVFAVVAFIFLLMVFGSVTVDQISIGSGGNIHKNGPSAIAETSMIMTIFFMFAATAFVANVVVRDDETGFGPIIHSTSVRKFDYLFGRFTGAFLAVSLAYAAVPLGIFLGSLMPWVDPETLGPNRLADYAFAFFWLALPNVFLVSALFFALATATRSMMTTYLGVAGFLVLYVVFNAVTRDPELRKVAAYIEPFGLAAFNSAVRYFTASDANTIRPAIEGALLYNRLVWIGAAFAMLGLSYSVYQTEAVGMRDMGKAPKVADVPPAPLSGRLPAPSFGAEAGWSQLFLRMRFEMGQVFKSPAFLVLLVLGLFNSLAGLLLGAEVGGSAIYPVTRWVINTLNGAFTFMVVIIAVYYAGELVWRDRDRKTHEIVDATAAPDWTFLLPKTLALILVLFATLAISALGAILVQLGKGFTDLQLGKYLFWYIIPNAIDWALVGVLAIFLQAISPHKFIGWGAMVLYLIATITLPKIGLEHNLYLYGFSSPVPLSDMNGQGDFAGFAGWFRGYWSAIAILLLVLSYGLWRRGTETRLAPRLKRLPRKLFGPAGVLAGLSIITAVGLGGYIFTNTNVWNEYRTTIDNEKYLADYEKTLLKFQVLPQPSITDVDLRIDLRPHESRITTSGAYELVNRTGAPLKDVHVRVDRDVKLLQLALTGAKVTKNFDRFNYRIFTFDQPLAPGGTATLTFETELAQKGFKNSGNITTLVDNGTFLNNYQFAPIIGMNRGELLKERVKRRKYGLPSELRPPKLEDRAAQAKNYAVNSDWVNARISITTEADQTPIAPGYLVSDVTENGRRTAVFKTDAPVLNFFSIQSARYAVRKVMHKGVELAVYYDAQHPWNVDRMLKAMATGLDYYQANFGPYQFHQARIIEFPDYAQFAQAFANTMPYSEGIGFVADPSKPDKIDYNTYITAHELAHQWWAHQIIGADMQGATVLSETLAQYSALIVMEKTYGPDGIRKFLKRELDSYLRNRGGDVVEELPLIRVEDQGYIHYRKGSLVMYLLRDQLGENTVNAALRKLLADHAFKGAPFPRSQDLVDALRAEVGSDAQAQELITDLFEKITLYDLKTKAATARKRPDGRYDLTLSVDAKKAYADGKGKETAAPLTYEVFDIGAFDAKPEDKAFGAKDVIYFHRRPLRSGAQTITVIVDKLPKYAGLDPYNKRIDRNSDDNDLKVELLR